MLIQFGAQILAALTPGGQAVSCVYLDDDGARVGEAVEESTAPQAATPRRMISITSVLARSNALSLSGAPAFRVAISCAAFAYCCVVAQIM